MLAITRHMRRSGRVWIRVFPDVPVDGISAEVRQGKGKGTVEYWAARVKPGRIMFGVDGVSKEIATVALELAAAKLPVQTKVVTRLVGEETNHGERGRSTPKNSKTNLKTSSVPKREQLNLRFQRSSGQLEATSRVGEVRRDIARIKTIMTERRHAAAEVS